MELIKSIGDMQRRKQIREKDLVRVKIAAANKVIELQQELAATQGELEFFDAQKTALENTFETTLVECREALDSLNESKCIIDELNVYLCRKHESTGEAEKIAFEKQKMALLEDISKLKIELTSTKSKLNDEIEVRAASEKKEAQECERCKALSAEVAALKREQALLKEEINRTKETSNVAMRQQIEEQKRLFTQKKKELITQPQQIIIDLKAEVKRLKSTLAETKHEAVVERSLLTQKMF